MKFNKFVLIFISISLMLSNTFPVLAMTNSVEDNTSIAEVTIDPYNTEEVEDAIIKYELLPEVADDLRKFSKNCIEGEVEGGEVSIPISTLKDSTSKRTYKGYKKKTYYEQLVKYSQKSSREKEILEGTVSSNDLKKVLKLGVKVAAGSKTNTVSAGTIDLIDLIREDAESNSAYKISARLRETKTKRYTYVVENDKNIFGSLTETATRYFIYYDLGYRTYSSSPETWETPNFKSGYDEIAYYAYPNGGENETILSYSVKGTSISSLA